MSTIGKHETPRALFDKLMDPHYGSVTVTPDESCEYSWEGVSFKQQLLTTYLDNGKRSDYIMYCDEGNWKIVITVWHVLVYFPNTKPTRNSFTNPDDRYIRRTIKETFFEGCEERYAQDIMIASLVLSNTADRTT